MPKFFKKPTRKTLNEVRMDVEALKIATLFDDIFSIGKDMYEFFLEYVEGEGEIIQRAEPAEGDEIVLIDFSENAIKALEDAKDRGIKRFESIGSYLTKMDSEIPKPDPGFLKARERLNEFNKAFDAYLSDRTSENLEALSKYLDEDEMEDVKAFARTVKYVPEDSQKFNRALNKIKDVVGQGIFNLEQRKQFEQGGKEIEEIKKAISQAQIKVAKGLAKFTESVNGMIKKYEEKIEVLKEDGLANYDIEKRQWEFEYAQMKLLESYEELGEIESAAKFILKSVLTFGIYALIHGKERHNQVKDAEVIEGAMDSIAELQSGSAPDDYFQAREDLHDMRDALKHFEIKEPNEKDYETLKKEAETTYGERVRKDFEILEDIKKKVMSQRRSAEI